MCISEQIIYVLNVSARRALTLKVHIYCAKETINLCESTRNLCSFHNDYTIKINSER